MNYTDMTGPEMLTALGDDAGKWAKAFCQHLRKCYPQAEVFTPEHDFEGWMIGWFANAIEHSNDVRSRRP